MKNSKLAVSILLILMIVAGGFGYWIFGPKTPTGTIRTTAVASEPYLTTTHETQIRDHSTEAIEPEVVNITEKGFEFRSFSTDNAIVKFEANISLEYAMQIADVFEFAREYIGKDFGVYPPRTFKIYIFSSQQRLVEGLIKVGEYTSKDAHFFDKEGVMPMPSNWVQYT